MSEIRIRKNDIIAPHFWNTFGSKITHQIDMGGRGSTKTSKNSIKIPFHCLQELDCSAIAIRCYQNTLRNSVYKEIKRGLNRLHLSEGKSFESKLSPLEIKLKKNGNTIYFAGGDDYEKIKGMIDETKPIKILWFEELTEFDSPEDIDQIIATFTRGNNDWFIVLYSFNPPKNKFHWVNVWVENMRKRDDCIITQTDYRTVPEHWIGKIFIEQAEQLKLNDEKRYKWIYLGEVIGIEGLIFNPDLITFVAEDYIENNNIKIIYIDNAIDCGHQTSATSNLCIGFGNDGYWYLLDTYYYSPNEKAVKKAPVELSKDIFNFKIENAKRYKTNVDKETIDSAEGAIRNQYFKDYGIRLNPVNKGSNKEELIDFAQDFLAKRKFRVLDTANNSIFKKELQNYMWIQDSVEKGKPIPDKTERAFLSSEKYYNSYTRDYAYTYGDHTQDCFQYWVKDNLQKLGLKY